MGAIALLTIGFGIYAVVVSGAEVKQRWRMKKSQLRKKGS